MDIATAQKVIELTSDFYSSVADSFSETRASAWKGWQRVLDTALAEVPQPLCVLDVACGNMRFEKFMAESGAYAACADSEVRGEDRDCEGGGFLVRSVSAVDGCSQLAERNIGSGESFPFPVRFIQADLFQNVEGGGEANGLAEPPNFTVCFGFMHHVPMYEQRLELLNALVRATCPGGIVAVSFWQFAKSERLLRKAKEATERATKLHSISFDCENDYLLGWQSEQDVFRYCHNYTEEEIDSLVGSLEGALQVARFSSDGSTDDLNRYAILKVKGL